ncbi:MAG: hypothetical protein R3E96_16590 [Planctomycetota bacterium]
MTNPTRLLEVDLSACHAPGPLPGGALRILEAGDLPGDEARFAAAGGSALALAAAGGAAGDEGLLLVVGAAVARGQATASRATLIARSPLTGFLAQGQLGSDLGRRLAGFGAGLWLRGRTDLEDAVLACRADGTLALVALTGIAQMEVGPRAQAVCAALGPGAVLRPGPAAHAGVRFANLAAGRIPRRMWGAGAWGCASCNAAWRRSGSVRCRWRNKKTTRGAGRCSRRRD